MEQKLCTRVLDEEAVGTRLAHTDSLMSVVRTGHDVSTACIDMGLLKQNNA